MTRPVDPGYGRTQSLWTIKKVDALPIPAVETLMNYYNIVIIALEGGSVATFDLHPNSRKETWTIYFI